LIRLVASMPIHIRHINVHDYDCRLELVDGTQCLHTIHSRGHDFNIRPTIKKVNERLASPAMKQRPESFRIRAFCVRLRDAFHCPFPMFPLVSIVVFPSRVSEATSLYGSSRGMPTRKNPRLFCYSSRLFARRMELERPIQIVLGHLCHTRHRMLNGIIQIVGRRELFCLANSHRPRRVIRVSTTTATCGLLALGTKSVNAWNPD
jgi:hypothetical protein